MFAVIISVVVTAVVYLRTRQFRAASQIKTRSIVAAKVALEPGVAIPAESLSVMQWPESVPLEGTLSTVAEATTRVPLYPIGANEPLLQRELAAPGSLGLSAKIPDGMRASAVKTNEVSNVAGFLFPGCKVDVLVSLRGPANTNVTRTVLQNVQVLSTGKKTEADPTGKPDNVNVVTLLVTPEQSEKLFWAQQQGGMQFVLRNGNDQKMSDVPEITAAEMRGITPSPAAPAAAPRHAKKVNVAPAYTVETVAGDKTTIAKFDGKSE